MKVLFICGVFAQENEQEVMAQARGYVEFSANIFQKKLIEGLSYENEVRVVSVPYIESYPSGSSMFRFDGFEAKTNYCEYVPFTNLMGWRNISRARSLKHHLSRNIDDVKDTQLVVVYGAHTPFLEAACFLKKINPTIKICYIVPDLPQYMVLENKASPLYRFLKAIDIKHLNSLTKMVDSFIILTEPMKDMLSVGSRPYAVVEGISYAIEKITSNSEKLEPKAIVYAGKLNLRFGIHELIKAFREIDRKDIQLVLCGDGDAREVIEANAKEDSRILFKGLLPYDEAQKVIKGATVLVNPRTGSEDYTRYSFPSKTIEYILTGNPVVAYILDGMPDVYKRFLYPVKSTLKQALIDALDAPESEVKSKYDSAVCYLNENRTPKRVAEIIEQVTFGSNV